ncbi:DUF402 domain-containing protein [Clostridium oryzae]|uniref:DUF402 domain-containing protein n=1 Tax=Clostridium oryzae TaxID=1450648 RepID=A0A1V4IKL0_9CLOT|nr:DUF402 domain-containing protein [Clostridium oryzae]OPJ60572.1 hypothetical protein CLORY_27480 [Clostridium oryzae]
MKRSRLSYDEWKCILSKKQTIKLIRNETVNGYISLIDIKEVSIPQVWKFNGQDIVVCYRGYKWLSILLSNEYYCITTMLNDKDEILLWYVDMIWKQGVDNDDVPYFYDLYLDLVVYPNGEIIEDDMDELIDALHKGEITLEQYNLAINTCENLKAGLLADIELFKKYTNICFDLIRK